VKASQINEKMFLKIIYNQLHTISFSMVVLVRERQVQQTKKVMN